MKKQQRNRLIVAAVLTVLCALLALVPFTGLEAQGKGVLIVFVWAILMWIVRPIPEYLIGVLAAAVLAIFFGMKTNVVSGFSSSGWWLCLWAGFIGSAIKFSGLGERVAYWILVKMGKTELMANYATSIANTVLSLMIPSNTARGAVMSPICDNICEGMGYKRGEHKGDAAIMLSNLFTNTTNAWLFYTAVGANAIGMALVTEVTGQEISWTGWLQATFIPAGITLLLIPILCHLLFGAKKGEKREIDITFAKEKLKEMGPMSKNEKKAGLYFLLTLIAFCTNKWHHIAPDYIVFVTIFLMLCPGIGDDTANLAVLLMLARYVLTRGLRVHVQGSQRHVCLAGFPAARLCDVAGDLREQDRWLPVAGRCDLYHQSGVCRDEHQHVPHHLAELRGRAAHHLRRHERDGSGHGPREHDDGLCAWL